MSTWAEQPLAGEPGWGIGNDGLTAEERAAGVAPMFEPPLVVDSGAKCSCPPAQIWGSGGDLIDQSDGPNCPQHHPLG